MFKTLEEVRQRWQQLYVEFKWRDYNFTSPGYSDEEIESLESALGIKLNPSFRNLLRHFNLDSIRFNTVSFGANRHYIDMLREMMPGSKSELSESLFQIGFADGSVIVMDNETGEIFVADEVTMEPVKVAENLEKFLCIAATIEDTQWPGFITKNKYDEEQWDPNSETDEAIEKFIRENKIKVGQEFWRGLVNGLY